MIIDELDQVVAFSAADHKHAALFFDRIVPLHSGTTVPESIVYPFWEKLKREDIILKIKVMSDYPEYIELIHAITETNESDSLEFSQNLLALMKVVAGKEHHSLIQELELPIEEYKDYLISSANDELDIVKDITLILNLSKAKKYMENVILNRLALSFTRNAKDNNSNYVPLLGRRPLTPKYIPDGDDATVSWILSNIKLANTRNATWDQIMEVRNDAQSMLKLRRLRLLLSDNYVGKSKAYVKDSIECKIADYETACKKHGLEMMHTTLEALLDPKSLLGIGAITATSAITGEGSFVGVTAGVVAAFHAGRTSVSIVKKHHDLKDWKSNHGLAYLIDLKEKLPPEKPGG